ncbi:MAG: ESX secretion-associated protein EspG, partial [Actinomycetota bacterium]|nr:ESX secretion-associated protein EspG [Actinomycetota bacterium]
LPTQPPGRMPAVMVPLTPPATRRDDGSVLIQASAGHGERERQAAEAILTAPHPRSGQIAANARHASGRVRRSAVLRWCDKDGDGRYHMTLTRQRNGHEWLAVSPADAQRLNVGVQRLLASLVPP